MTHELHEILQAGALCAARRLLGCRLVHVLDGHVLAGRIVETEAYTQDDPASHCFGGATDRNRAMFGPAGHAYVYISYGMHRCMNVVTGRDGVGEAVLLRAVEPLEGLDEMVRRRNWRGRPLRNLCNGPGKLCQAMGIGLEVYGTYLLGDGPLRLESGRPRRGERVDVTPRIGITKATDWPRRFVLSEG